MFNSYDLGDTSLKTTSFTPIETPTSNVPKLPTQQLTRRSVLTPIHHSTSASGDITSRYEVSSNSNLENAVNQYSGMKYGFGSTGQNGKIDCSSFVQKVEASLGKTVPRTASQQKSASKEVALQDVQPGDQLYLKGTYGGKNHISHTGIFLGWNADGTARVAESSSSKGSGVHNWDLRKGYHANHFAGAGRFAKNGMKFQDGGEILTTNFEAITVPESSTPSLAYKQPTDTTPQMYVTHSDSKSDSSNWWENYQNSTPQQAASVDSVINRIVKGGYATDSNYGNKLKQMVSDVQKQTGSNQVFVNKRLQSYMSRGLDQNTALVYTAQDALESGYGKHTSGAFNYGGIKGAGKTVSTTEEKNGKKYTTQASFRNFANDDAYTDYKINLLNQARYNQA